MIEKDCKKFIEDCEYHRHCMLMHAVQMNRFISDLKQITAGNTTGFDEENLKEMLAERTRALFADCCGISKSEKSTLIRLYAELTKKEDGL